MHLIRTHPNGKEMGGRRYLTKKSEVQPSHLDRPSRHYSNDSILRSYALSALKIDSSFHGRTFQLVKD